MFAKTLTALAATATLGSFIAVAAPTVSAEAASRHLSGPHTVRPLHGHSESSEKSHTQLARQSR